MPPCNRTPSNSVTGHEMSSILATDYQTYRAAAQNNNKRKTAYDITYKGHKDTISSWMSRDQIYAITKFPLNQPVRSPFDKVKGVKFHFARDPEKPNVFIITASPVDKDLEHFHQFPKIRTRNFRSDLGYPNNKIDVDQVAILAKSFKKEDLRDGNFHSFKFTRFELLYLLGHDEGDSEDILFDILLFPPLINNCSYFKVVEQINQRDRLEPITIKDTILPMSNGDDQQCFYACPTECY